MSKRELSDQQVILSWQSNASPWVAAVREQQIESRRLITDAAIVQAVLDCKPSTVLDIGCGEGWLARALAEHGMQVLGVDVVAELVDAANTEHPHHRDSCEFRVMSYEEVAAGGLQQRFDLLVCNFSLIGQSSVDTVVAAAPQLLNRGGHLVIQTLHPVVSCGDHTYTDGWREGSWAGFSDAFSNPPPWYFRTLESWISLITGSGLSITAVKEPVHSAGSQPASLILVASNPN